ncbi:hypothetical protein MHY87_11790 [Microvirga sp. ACRRW]|uniref:hypothetical protein n=1 Tax=Microvirga sp. ACRRW TaxID=2918205 RepID=UPI001EF567C8|nr:hypothetical protein [Microvirga sp. ACRRW]MCG7393589.1 hypothetical protein [Microvirga sp. ACRRW]
MGDLLSGRAAAPDIVQPQPKASADSMALGVQLCVCELISGDDKGECGNGEATLFIHWKLRNMQKEIPFFRVRRWAASQNEQGMEPEGGKTFRVRQ